MLQRKPFKLLTVTLKPIVSHIQTAKMLQQLYTDMTIKSIFLNPPFHSFNTFLTTPSISSIR